MIGVYDESRKEEIQGAAEAGREEARRRTDVLTRELLEGTLRRVRPELDRQLQGFDPDTTEELVGEVLVQMARLYQAGKQLRWDRWLVLAVRAAARRVRAAAREQIAAQLTLGLEEWIAERGDEIVLWRVRRVKPPCGREIEGWIRRERPRPRRGCIWKLAVELGIAPL